MAMGPIIIVGCGGSGGAVVTALRNRLENHLRRIGWDEGIPQSWQLIWADTPQKPEELSSYGPTIPQDDYVCLSQGLPTVAQVYASVKTYLGKDKLKLVEEWAPNPNVPTPIGKGAGQWRAIGRLAAVMSLKNLGERIDSAMTQISLGQGQLDRLTSLLGETSSPETDPTIIVVSSLAGGTGSGVFLDVCDVIRAKRPTVKNKIMGVLFTAEIFDHLGLAGLEFNTVGALGEMLAGYYAEPQEFPELYKSAFSVPAVDDAPRGVNFPFIVGKKTLSGSDMNSTDDVYRSVTDTLSSIFLNSEVNKEFSSFLLANWGSEQLNHSFNNGRGSFMNQREGTADVPNNGAVSSFGSARLCVGSDMFAEYSAHRMSREILEFMYSGFLNEGRRAMGDNAATAPQVLKWFRENHGLSFISDCNLREVNLGEVAQDDILNRLISDELINNQVLQDFVPKLQSEISSWAEMPQTQLHQKLLDHYPRSEPDFLSNVAGQLDRKTRDFVTDAPNDIIRETSSMMARFGVPVALEMLSLLDDHLQQATEQLKNEITTNEELAGYWQQYVAEAFAKLKAKDKVDGKSPYAQKACVKAANSALGKAQAEVRRRALELITDIRRQVIDPLKLQLEQVSKTLESNDGVVAVGSWPTSNGVPLRFAPSPLDFALIDSSEWPNLYNSLVIETLQRETEDVSDPQEHLRRVVGGGGFKAQAFGSERISTQALTIKSPWTRTRPVEFTVSISADEILERARTWINRSGTPFGDFANTTLGKYLSATDAQGNPIPEHQIRLNKFKDSLTAALTFAQPLVHVDPMTFNAVHGKPAETMIATRIVPERLPVTGTARDIAEHVIKDLPTVLGKRTIDDFFTDSHDAESVLYVSRILGAVHPMTISSVSAPIFKQWNVASVDGKLAAGVWQYRRSRSLPEYIPMRPRVRQSMVRGWIVGRLLGLVSAPTENSGPELMYEGRKVSFLWPTLQGQSVPNLHTDVKKQLPAILETSSLAMLLGGMQEDFITPYEALYAIGENYETLIRKFIADGRVEGEVISPVVNISDGDDANDKRASELRSKLQSNADDYQKIALQPSVYGFDLATEIVEQCILIQKVSVADARTGGDF